MSVFNRSASIMLHQNFKGADHQLQQVHTTGTGYNQSINSAEVITATLPRGLMLASYFLVNLRFASRVPVLINLIKAHATTIEARDQVFVRHGLLSDGDLPVVACGFSADSYLHAMLIV